MLHALLRRTRAVLSPMVPLAAALVAGSGACALDFDPKLAALACGSHGLVTRTVSYALPEPVGCAPSAASCIAVTRGTLVVGTTRRLAALDLASSGVRPVTFAPADSSVDWVVRGVALSGSTVHVAASEEQRFAGTAGVTHPVLVASLPIVGGALRDADASTVFDAGDTREVDVAPLPADAAALSTLGTATYVTRPPSTGPGLLGVDSWPGADAQSGSRLVARIGGQAALLSNAGRPTQSLRRTTVPVQVPGEDFGSNNVLAGSPQGIVVSAVPVLGGPTADGGKAILAVRLVWLLRDDLDTSFAAPQRVDVVTYDPPLSTKQLDGPLGTVAVVDYERAFIAIPDPADPTRSRGFVATRATTPPSLVPALEAGFPYPASRLVATVADGVVYLVALRGTAGLDVFTLGASCGG